MTDLFQSDILVPMGCKEILGFGISFSHHSGAHDVGQNVVVDNINAVKNTFGYFWILNALNQSIDTIAD